MSLADLQAQPFGELRTTALHRFQIRRQDTLFEFFVLGPNQAIQTSKKYKYEWYLGDSIFQTTGGFSGRLLDGIYTQYYPNHALAEQGLYSKGLKIGEWRSWFPEGQLKSSIHWKNGQKNGHFEIYRAPGQKSEAGKYHRDLLVGNLTNYDLEGQPVKTHYKRGILKEDHADKKE